MAIFCVGKNEIISLFNNIISSENISVEKIYNINFLSYFKDDDILLILSSVFDNYYQNYIKIKNVYIYTYFPSNYSYLTFKENGLKGYFFITTEISDLKNNLLKVSRFVVD